MIRIQLAAIVCVIVIPAGAHNYGPGFSSLVNDEARDEPRVVALEVEEATNRAGALREKLWREFKRLTNFDAANRAFQHFVLPRLNFLQLTSSMAYDGSDDTIDGRLTEWRDRVLEYLEKKVEALKNLVRTAEMVVANYSVKPPPFKEDCDKTFVDVREATNESDFLAYENAIHIPIGVVNCSGIVQRDVTWLGHEALTRSLEHNLDADPTILRQYIAAADSAVTRLYPVSPWKLYPPDTTVDLFDPRGRHWYIKAVSCPKDIIFLVDLSGSVAGQTRHLMKLTIMTILTTLTPDDYINAIWYNKEVGVAISNCSNSFIPATTRNKLLLQRWLDSLEEIYEADFEKALKFTYDEFVKWENITRENADRYYGSGCHKCLFVLTDTVQETGQQLFEKYGFNNDTLDIRLFGFAMGFNTPDIEALQLMSCRRNGGYFKVDSLEDIKDQSIAYLSILSRPLAMSMYSRSFEARQVSWAGPYMDAQGEGPILTLSMPILNKMKGASTDRFVGVAAIDVKLSTLRDLADAALVGPDSYVFAVDNNGNVLFHPNMRVPDIDLQMIRRSACFEATPAKRRSEADKVIFWETTEEVKMQMGLMDTMFTIDLSELEKPTRQLLKLRENMASGHCEEGDEIVSETIQHFGKRYARKAEYAYRCRKLSRTPYSFGLAMKRLPRSPSTKVKEGAWVQKRNFTNSSVTWIPSPRIYCEIDLSAEKAESRWNRLTTNLFEKDFECSDTGRAARLFLDYDAINQWLNNTVWIEDDANQSCIKAVNLYKDSFVPTFIQTEGGLTAFYPKCSWRMPASFSKDVVQSEYYQYVRLWPRELSFTWTSADADSVTMFAAVYNQENDYIPAVIGAQVPIISLWHWWRSAGGNRSEASFSRCWSDYAQRVCYLITRHFSIIGSSSPLVTPAPNLHFGMVEPYLFEHLANKSSEKTVFTDYQDRCPPDEGKIVGSASDAGRIRFMSIIDLIYGLLSGFCGIWSSSFWMSVWSLISSPLPSPTYGRLEGCETKRPRNEEQCIMQYQFYVFEPNGSFSPGSYYDDGCDAMVYYQWTKIEGTNLYLIEVHRPPHECRRSRPIIYSLTPVRRFQCQEVVDRGTLLPRRRYRTDCVDFHEKESKGYNEDACAGNAPAPARFVILLLFVLHFTHAFSPSS